MLPTFCPPTIWAISLEFYRKLSILVADDFLGACYRKAMTPKKLWTLPFPQPASVHEALFSELVLCIPFLHVGQGSCEQQIQAKVQGPMMSLWGGKTGSICHFAFSIVLQYLAVPCYPDVGKNSTKCVIVTPVFVHPQMLVKLGLESSVPICWQTEHGDIQGSFPDLSVTCKRFVPNF